MTYRSQVASFQVPWCQWSNHLKHVVTWFRRVTGLSHLIVALCCLFYCYESRNYSIIYFSIFSESSEYLLIGPAMYGHHDWASSTARGIRDVSTYSSWHPRRQHLQLVASETSAPTARGMRDVSTYRSRGNSSNQASSFVQCAHCSSSRTAH